MHKDGIPLAQARGPGNMLWCCHLALWPPHLQLALWGEQAPMLL